MPVGNDADVTPGRETRLEIDNRLDRLSQVNPAVCSVVEMRTFNEWNSPETVPRQACSTRTADRYWNFGRMWPTEETGALIEA